MIDPNHPFYNALWRRLLVPGVCFAWVVTELVIGSPTWAAIVGAVGVYATYKLFFERRKPAAERPPEPRDE